MDIATLFGIVSLTLGSEFLSLILRWFSDEKAQKRFKKITLSIAGGLSSIFILGLLVSLMFASTLFIYSALSNTSKYGFYEVVYAFSFLFILAFLFVHVFGFCFAGFLHKWPFSGKFWPKGIDYIYYIFGAALVLIAANIFEEQALVASAIRTEVVVGIYLFNLKIFKTTYELFPAQFKCSDGWVRDPFFGKII